MKSNDNLIALNYVCGQHVNICRLCFSSTEHEEISTQDNVIVETPYCSETIQFTDMLKIFGISPEPMLPQNLCARCASTTINSYLFQKLCQYSNDTWNNSLDNLTASLSQSESVSSNVQSVFLMLNKNSNTVLKSRRNHKIKTKKQVLTQIKAICKNRQKYLKKKCDGDDHICEECGKRFISSIFLAKHEHKKFPCPKCSKIFLTAFKLRRHMERIHYPKNLHCDECSKSFSTEKMLKVHKKFSHQAIACHLCFIELPSKKALKVHLGSHEVNICPKCKKNFKNKDTFRRHIRKCGREDGKQLYICDICSKEYGSKKSLSSHLTITHGFGVVISCDWCDKKFDCKNQLKCHIVKHTRERNFNCDQCGGLFVTRAALLYHTRLHTGERPFPCDICGESFLSASRRMEHKKRKHIGPTKECDVCHVKFVTSHQLRKHVVRHYNPQSKLYVANLKKNTDEKNIC